MYLSDCIIILVNPFEGGNIGSVCRAMKTMNIERLSIVGKNYTTTEIEKMAVHAFDIYEKAIHFETLQEALANTTLSAGMTRRRGENRKHFSLPCSDFIDQLFERPRGDVGIVFGNEKHGLSHDELSLCTISVHIPTWDEYPSLNLAQAVQIVTYELFNHRNYEKRGAITPLSSNVISNEIFKITKELTRISFNNTEESTKLSSFLSDLLSRSHCTKSELAILNSFLRKIIRKLDIPHKKLDQ